MFACKLGTHVEFYNLYLCVGQYIERLLTHAEDYLCPLQLMHTPDRP